MPWPASSMRLQQSAILSSKVGRHRILSTGRPSLCQPTLGQSLRASIGVLSSLHSAQACPLRSPFLRGTGNRRSYTTSTDQPQSSQVFVQDAFARYNGQLELSEKAQQRFGFRTINVNVGEDEPYDIESSSVLPAGHEVVKVLERSCRTIEGSGIILCLAAAADLARCFPDLHYLGAMSLVHEQSKAAQQSSTEAPSNYKRVSVDIQTRANKSFVKFEFLPAEDFDIRLADASSPPIKQSFAIKVRYVQDDGVQVDAPDDDIRRPLPEDLRAPSKAINAVIRQLSQGMVFASAQSMAAYISEALMRTLQGQLPGAKVDRVSVTALSRSRYEPAVTASTALADTAHDEVMQPQLPKSILASNNARPSWPEIVRRLDDKRSEIVVLSGDNSARGTYVTRKKALRVHSRPSLLFSAVSRKTGCERLGYTISISRGHAPDALHIDCDNVDRLIREHADQSSMRGFGFLPALAESVATCLPQRTIVRLDLVAGSTSLPASCTLRLGNELRVFGESAVATEGSWTIVLPSLYVDDLLKSSMASVRLTLTITAQMVKHTDSNSDLNIAQQTLRELNGIQAAIKPQLSAMTVDELNDEVAMQLAQTIVRGQHLFLSQLRVTSMNLNLANEHRSIGRAWWQSQPETFAQVDDVSCVDASRDRQMDSENLHQDQEVSSVVALGSNFGDRLRAIEDACSAIDADPDMRIVRTSNLYESEPMYVEDQATFLNGVCQIRTQLAPMDLLDRLQAIELGLGRVKLIDKGPRNIDLDILLYGDNHMKRERLTIPHQLMKEREFVLRPLDNLGLGHIEPLNSSAQNFLKIMGAWDTPSMYPQVSLGPAQLAVSAGAPRRGTQIMAILNMTPDSFSDGGDHEPTNLEKLRDSISAHVHAGATLIDIGGQSSRPNAPDVTAEDEIARILPAIQVIKSIPEAERVAISVDTYRASVAEAAFNAGAHIINDISGGLLDSEMLPTVARLGCTYIMMHMRGAPATMQNEENLQYPDGLIPTISTELKARLDAAEDAGIRRWRIILDPGIGFSKTVDQNLEILRELPALRSSAALRDMPWLIGSSRKGFVGKITGVAEAKDRTWGTAATVTAAVQGGAEIVRVHDVAEMAQVVKMSDAMYRV